ncbi:uncharacterized protein LOC111866453 isoform X3 [Cryptotermes secundus]|uniref:uncharacterized protein LOC111866453 isoform X3 n=1 Tax=Cryptotermes secundus TaxID=105785 RepID=UPI001454E223|nr:uncharacterized protein LOC111866453 isoform X3 [Cryptotermes secundus]
MSENTAENSMSEDTPDKTKSDMLLKERSDMLLKEILETLECPVCREYMVLRQKSYRGGWKACFLNWSVLFARNTCCHLLHYVIMAIVSATAANQKCTAAPHAWESLQI